MEPADVHPDLDFAGTCLQGSRARTRLYTAIAQQLGASCQEVYMVRTYGELYAAIYGTAPEQHVQENGMTSGIACWHQAGRELAGGGRLLEQCVFQYDLHTCGNCLLSVTRPAVGPSCSALARQKNATKCDPAYL